MTNTNASLQVREGWEVHERYLVLLVGLQPHFIEELSPIEVHAVANHVCYFDTGSPAGAPVLLILDVVALYFFYFLLGYLLDTT